MSDNKVYLCIHGHFYQPPRENAWLEEIESQPTAAPWHDWNERIHDECYLPNAMARILDANGEIVDVVNNYEKISFNFGPTLFSWIEDKHPKTYRLILEADRRSLTERGGHGNAIAQAYNHMIMPLANRRDKETQVRWGVADFRRRFQREPESIWLPETACNDETMDVLIENKMKYVILEPHQAEAVRPFDGKDWQDVSQGQIDPKEPYRYFSKNLPGLYIDVFFYDGPISKAIGFEDALVDAKRWMERIEMAKVSASDAIILHMATDGETYGHHKVFGDRVLAYLLTVLAPQAGYRITNYGQYLEQYPPRFAVNLKRGPDGEGTSWSCAHGVRRWKEHCGCRGGGPADWNQHWRKPLRESLDWLRDELAKIYEEWGGRYFKDVWAARNDYIDVILDRTDETIESYLIDQLKTHPLSKEERVVCLKLLEIERHAMLMYTSCGWFFTELSGIETVQVIQYAARAIQLAHEVSQVSLEEEFLKRLSAAKSNLPDVKDGRGVYERFVRPSMVSIHSIASLYAVGSTLEHFYHPEEALRIYHYTVQPLHLRRESFGDMTINFGRLKVSSHITKEEQDLIFITVQIGLRDFRCSFKQFKDIPDFEALEKEFFDRFHSYNIVELIRKIDAHFGEKYFALKDLPYRERKEILSLLTREAVEKISEVHERIYDENRKLSEVYRSMNLSIPVELRYAAEHTLSKRLYQILNDLAAENFSPKKARTLYRIIEEALSFGIEIQKEQARHYLTLELSKRTEAVIHEPQDEHILTCINLLKLVKKVNIELDLRASQDHLFDFLKKWGRSAGQDSPVSQSVLDHLLQLADMVGINIDEYKKKLQKVMRHS